MCHFQRLEKTEVLGFPQTELLQEDTAKVGVSAFMLCCVIAPSKLGLNSKTWVDTLDGIFRQIFDPCCPYDE